MDWAEIEVQKYGRREKWVSEKGREGQGSPVLSSCSVLIARKAKINVRFISFWASI